MNEVVQHFEDKNKDYPKEKLKQPDFRNVIKVSYIGKPSIDWKRNLEKLITEYVEYFKKYFSLKNLCVVFYLLKLFFKYQPAVHYLISLLCTYFFANNLFLLITVILCAWKWL